MDFHNFIPIYLFIHLLQIFRFYTEYPEISCLNYNAIQHKDISKSKMLKKKKSYRLVFLMQGSVSGHKTIYKTCTQKLKFKQKFGT